MFDALWTLRVRWRLWLGTTGLLLLGTAGPLWWQLPPPRYQAEATVVIGNAGEKPVLLGRLNSGLIARAAGLRAGETVSATPQLGQPELVRIVGLASTSDRAIAVANGVVATVNAQVTQETMAGRLEREVAWTLTRRRLDAEYRQVEAAVKRLPAVAPPPVAAGGTLIVVGQAGPTDVVRVALEHRYLELTKLLAAPPPGNGAASPVLIVLDPAVEAVGIPASTAPVRAALIASLVIGLFWVWIREWWARERAQRQSQP